MLAQPQWISMINDSQLDSGEQLHWECRAAGKPRPTYHWLRNGEPLSPQVHNTDTHFNWESRGGKHGDLVGSVIQKYCPIGKYVRTFCALYPFKSWDRYQKNIFPSPVTLIA